MQPEQFNRILQAVPGFRPIWESFTAAHADEEFLPWYSAMSELAAYVVDSYASGSTNELPGLFSVVEDLLQTADRELDNLLAVGLFEDIQNIASHREFGYSVFRQWLGTRSLFIWDEVDAGMTQVAQWVAAQGFKSAVDVEQALADVTNPELRRILEASYRKAR